MAENGEKSMMSDLALKQPLAVTPRKIGQVAPNEKVVEKPKKSLGANMHDEKELVHMKAEDFEKAGITGCNKKIAEFLIGKWFNLYNQILVGIYVVFSIFVFSFEDWLDHEVPHATHYSHIVEACFVSLFLLDCLVHIVAFGRLHIRDSFSILDLVVILLVLTFIFLEMFLTTDENGEFNDPMEKTFGFLRVLHACLVFRKIDEIIRDYKAINRVH